jgi:hypothetical protein
LEGWNRCEGAPDEPAGLLGLADQIFEEDFPDLYQEEGDNVRFLYEALLEAFQYFDPAKGNPNVSANTRFGRFFRRLFRRRLGRASDRMRS